MPAAAVPPPGEKIQIPEGRFWLVNLTAEQGGPGLLALWWKCPHLGCTVPWRPDVRLAGPDNGRAEAGLVPLPLPRLDLHGRRRPRLRAGAALHGHDGHHRHRQTADLTVNTGASPTAPRTTPTARFASNRGSAEGA